MGDFCKDCSIEMFGKDFQELANLCQAGYVVQVLCENCGYIWVDESGTKVAEDNDG